MISKIPKIVLTTALTLLFAAEFFAQGDEPRLIPIAKGWAKNQVNAVIFRKNSVTTFRNKQYVAFYDEDSKVTLAKRSLNSRRWEIRRTRFFGDTADAHNSISLAADGAGFLHLAWGMHNQPLNYSRSLQPETLEFSDKTTMTGENEAKVTYPEFYNAPDGNLLFFYRDGASGSGNLVLNFYDAKRRKWLRRQSSLIDGEGSRNAYPQITVDRSGAIHLSWVWRETPNVATNHDLCYAVSRDNGKTWRKSSGETYRLPITAARAEYIRRIPQNSELINQTSMTADSSGNPYIATYWRDHGSPVPQFRIVYFNGEEWNSAQVGERRGAFSLSGAGTKKIPISRPQIAVDGKKVYVVFRDEERGSRASAAICDDLRKNVWRFRDLTETEVGMWEPTFDESLWRREKKLHLFVQKVGQGDGEKLDDIPPQMISILEWKP